MILKNKWLRVIPVLLLLISFTQIGSTRPSLASSPTIAGLPASFFELDGNACQDTSPRPDWGV